MPIKVELTKGRGFIPIGNNSTYTISTTAISGNYFKGTFDGNNKAIQNILIDATGNAEYLGVGLFGILNGTVKNLTISGSIKGTNNSTSISSMICIGGIAGQVHNGIVSSCNNTCAIIQTQSVYCSVYAGGITGLVQAPINLVSHLKDCSNYGVMNIGGGREYTHIGGIAGASQEVKIYNCINYQDIENTYAYTTTASYNFVYIGGITGLSNADTLIMRCGNIGNIVNKGDLGKTSLRTGGIVGLIKGSALKSNYNKGNMSSIGAINGTAIAYSSVGGIYGEGLDDGFIEYNYSVGTYSGTGASYYKYGGIYGVTSGNTVIKYCYYLGDTELNQGTGVSRKTDEQIKSIEFAQLIGPDFMKNPQGGYPIFETRYAYSSASTCSGGNTLTAKIDAKAGDLLVATITTSSTTTISEGWERIDAAQTINQDDFYQYLTFAYKEAITDGEVEFTVNQTDGTKKIQMNLIAIHGGGTPTLLTETETKGISEVSSPITQIKPCNELVIWTESSIWSGTNWNLMASPSIPSIGYLPAYYYQTVANFMDYRESGSSISFINPHRSAQTHVVGLKIEQN